MSPLKISLKPLQSSYLTDYTITHGKFLVTTETLIYLAMKDPKTWKNTSKHLEELSQLGKLPPSDTKIEEGILSIFLNHPTAIFKLISNFHSNLFYDIKNQAIAEVIIHCAENGVPIDIVSVAHEAKVLKIDKLINNISSVGYELSRIAGMTENITMLDYYHKILFQLYLKRQFILLGHELQEKGYDLGTDIFDIIDFSTEKISKYGEFFINEQKQHIDDVTDATIAAIISQQENPQTLHKTFIPKFDDLVQFKKDEIILMGGKSGSGKTKFIILVVSQLLKNNSDISILWYAMEDPPDKIIRAFISQITKLDDSQLLGRDYVIDPEMISLITELKQTIFDAWDIEFVNKPSRISHIKRHYEQFVNQRPDRLCLLIIDNIMLIEDNFDNEIQTKIDDKIAGEVKKISVLTHHPIILVHHFTDAQLEKTNLSSAYRPRESHLKGSTRYRDVSTQVILWNNPAQYPDLIELYKEAPWLDAMFIADVTKNRNNRTGIIRFFGNLATNMFYEI